MFLWGLTLSAGFYFGIGYDVYYCRGVCKHTCQFTFAVSVCVCAHLECHVRCCSADVTFMAVLMKTVKP